MDSAHKNNHAFVHNIAQRHGAKQIWWCNTCGFSRDVGRNARSHEKIVARDTYCGRPSLFYTAVLLTQVPTLVTVGFFVRCCGVLVSECVCAVAVVVVVVCVCVCVCVCVREKRKKKEREKEREGGRERERERERDA